jgi:iron complex transport system substrate-binding protein
MTGCGTSTEVGSSGETVAISHKFGETEVPENPTRVVTVGWNDQDFVLALGVVPIVTRAWFDSYDNYPWVQEATGGKGVETLSGGGIQYEDIAAAEPDVIFAIYETIDRATYDRLSQIAPTVIQSGEYPDEETPWHEQLLRTGKALGKDRRTAVTTSSARATRAARCSTPSASGAHDHVGDVSEENVSLLDATCCSSTAPPRNR